MPTQLYDIDLKLLRVFREVVRQQSFSLAAESLGTSLSSISMNIAQLESRLGMRLCERGVKGFRLTEQGQGLLDASEVLYQSMGQYQDQINALSEKMHTELRLGVLSELQIEGTVQLDRVIANIERLQPEATFSLEFRPAEQLHQKVINGELHAALGYFNELENQLERRYVTSQKHHCYCGKHHTLFDTPDDQISLKSLEAAKLAGYDDLFDCEKAAIPLYSKYDSCSRSGEGILALVLSGSHVGLLVDSFAEPWVDQGLLRPLLTDTLALDVEIELIYPNETASTALMQTLRTALAEIYPGVDAAG